MIFIFFFFLILLFLKLKVEFEVVVFFFRIICLACASIWPSCFCYFASQTTERVSSVGDVAYCSNWYEYPTHLQKYVTLVIVRSQQPMYFTGFNLIRCSIETFGKVNQFFSFIFLISLVLLSSHIHSFTVIKVIMLVLSGFQECFRHIIQFIIKFTFNLLIMI